MKGSGSRVAEDQMAVTVCHLNIWRKAIERYRADHGAWPGQDAPERFVAQLTGTTDAAGETGRGRRFPFGPYLPRGEVPINPITETNDVVVVGDWPEGPDGKAAWIYNRTTGEIRIDTEGITPDGARLFNF